MAESILSVAIEGRELLMHKFPVGGESGPKPDDPKFPAWSAEQSAYRNEDGDLCEPAMHILGAMVDAAKGVPIKGKGGKKTYKDAVWEEVRVIPELIPHLPKGRSYLIDAKPVRISKARVMRHRPLLRDWRLEFEVVILDTDVLSVEVTRKILVLAGRKGIGDFRPIFGQFQVVKCEEQ